MVGALCVVLMLTVPRRAAHATAVEYAAFLAITIVIFITSARELGPQATIPADHLKQAAEAARQANLDGNRPQEIAHLSQAIGAAHALMGMTSACGTCSDLRAQLQQAIGQAAALKTEALGAPAACKPDGVIGPTEQCDPLAVPTGCPITTEPSFCNAECQCEPAIIP
jgi:hypothetical protein